MTSLMTNLNRVSKPSGNWLSLRKVYLHIYVSLRPLSLILVQRLRATSPSPRKSRNKRQKRSEDSSRASNSSNVMPSVSPSPTGNSSLHGDSVETLRSLIFSPIPFPPDLPPKDRQPGQYIALDCEMVGVGPAGTESTLARVSVVNYFGAVLLDEFVRQKERVTDWRTQWSGIREKDMINGEPCLFFCVWLKLSVPPLLSEDI
jgi:RNA exonuclease 4